MVGSALCHLRDVGRGELWELGEESLDMGGYFLCNGLERVVRMLIAPRRHYILALHRGAYQNRGALYTTAATLLRCVRPDLTSQTVRCHMLTDGCVNFAITIRRAEYFIPVGLLLKALVETTDREIFERLGSGAPGGAAGSGGHAAFVAERAELLLRQAARLGVRTRAQCLAHLGKHFRQELEVPEERSDLEAGEQLLEDCVFVHLERPADKMALLVLMVQKLYALVDGQCAEDNPDALTHHEVLLPGHLLAKVLRERLEDCQLAVRGHVKQCFDRGQPDACNLGEPLAARRATDRMPDVGKKLEYLINTGNLVSRSGLDLQQAAGFSVLAEKLNFFRYLSHFRAIHRGAYFAEIRTTTGEAPPPPRPPAPRLAPRSATPRPR